MALGLLMELGQFSKDQQVGNKLCKFLDKPF